VIPRVLFPENGNPRSAVSSDELVFIEGRKKETDDKPTEDVGKVKDMSTSEAALYSEIHSQTYGEIYNKNTYKISKRVTPVPKEEGLGFYPESKSSILELSFTLEPEH